MRGLAIVIVVVAAVVGVGTLVRGGSESTPGEHDGHVMAADPAEPADTGAPDLVAIARNAPPEHAEGKRAFESLCATCHGTAANGTEQGPPLAHRIYEPSHHADIAFQLAVRNGVRAHHWRFGDMAPVPNVSDEQIAAITAYVRWLQRQIGIG